MDKLSKIEDVWHLINIHNSFISIPRVRKYLRNLKLSDFQLSKSQKEEINDFWNKYDIHFPYDWHKLFYGITGNYNPTFVPDNIFHHAIKNHLNNKTFATVWSDKCYLDKFLNNITTPHCIVRNVNGRFLNEKFEIIDIKTSQSLMNKYETLVIKPSILTDTGKGVQLLSYPYNLLDLHKEYKKNYIIQIPIIQHEKMKLLNASSVNTIRMNSALFDTEAVILSSFVKVGQQGSFADNNGHDRFFIGIGDNGMYKDYAIDHDLKRYINIPSGFVFSGQSVPSYDLACEMVKNAHKNFPHFGLAFWDVCINKDGNPMIIEVNLRSPDSYVPQAAVGPFFGNYTDTILDYIKKS